jgi:hypothetical protein
MKLLYCNQLLLKNLDKLDTVIYTGSKNIITNILPLVDRSGLIQMPYDFAIYDDFKMPIPDNSFNLEYQDCCEKRAREIIELSDKLQLPIKILWSGGIDSTLIIVTFIKLLGLNAAKDRIIILLSTSSIQENYNFYRNYVKDFKCESGYKIESLLDGSSIVITGEYNDQIFGTELANNMKKYFRGSYNYNDPYDRDKWFDYIVGKDNGPKIFQESFDSPYQDLGELETNSWLDLIEYTAENSGLGLSSMFDYWWWFNFNFKWQSIYFRLLIRADPEHRIIITSEFCKKHLIYFFADQRFQQWAFHKRNSYSLDRWQNFKLPAKQIIYEFDKNDDYFFNKLKKGSLYQILNDTNKCLAITDTFEFLDEFDPEDFYIEDNFFNRLIKKNGA